MGRPALFYLYEAGGDMPRAPDWPELGVTELAEAEDLYLQNFCMGYRRDISHEVIAVHRGSQYGLDFIQHLTEGDGVVALYGEPLLDDGGMRVWHDRLDALFQLREIIVCDFNRHDVISSLGRRAFWIGLQALTRAVGYLRGPAVVPSDESMASEAALSRAIESLAKAGYRAPKK